MNRLILTNTLEWVRLKFIHIVIVLAFLYYALSFLLGSLSFAEQQRLYFDFGLAGVEVATVFVAAFLATHAIHREIERKTILVLVARPIPRWKLLLSYLGSLTILNLIIVSILGATLYVSLEDSGKHQTNLLISLFVIWLKAVVVSCFGILCAVLARPMFGMVLTLCYWIAAYSIPDLIFLAEKLKSDGLIATAKFFKSIIANFYLFNWKNYQFLKSQIMMTDVMWAVAHCLFWIIVLQTIASIAFRKKEIV